MKEPARILLVGETARYEGLQRQLRALLCLKNLLAKVADAPRRGKKSLLIAMWICPIHAEPLQKIVEYGWDVPYPDFVRDNIREMEKQPFDGIIFRTKGFDHVFDIRSWEADKLKPQLDTLAQIEWGKFEHNFLTLYAANKDGMNWFDDEH